MTISTVAGTAFVWSQHPFVIRTPNELGIAKRVGKYEKSRVSTLYSVLENWKLKDQRQGKDKKASLVSPSKHSTVHPSQRQGKEQK